MEKLCLACGVEFKPRRKAQIYHSEACRKDAWRSVANGAENPETGAGTEKRRNGPFSSTKSKPKKRRLKKSKTRELGAFVLEQINAEKHKPNPIRFVTPDGTKCRVWLGAKEDRKGELTYPNGKRYSYIIGDEVYWGCNVTELLDREKKRLERKRLSIQRPTPKALRRPIIVVGRNDPVRDLKDALGELPGTRARVFINDQKELQILAARARHQAYLKTLRPSAQIIPFRPKLQEAA
jgi:hypothetical protein